MTQVRRAPSLFLFDDPVARDWHPFALTRPIGELRFGRWTLGERVAKASGFEVAGCVTGHASGAAADGAGLWNSRAVPDNGWPGGRNEGPRNFWVDGRLAGVFSRPGGRGFPRGANTQMEPVLGAPNLEVPGMWLDAPWRLVELGPDRLARDIAGESYPVPDGCWGAGDYPVLIAPGATVDPGVFFDARSGGIELGAGVTVGSGTHLVGPVYAGPGTRMLGGEISGVSCGRECRLRGEISNSTFGDYCNKAHDGFVGHSYLGDWVNLGAGTVTADLKHGYSPVRVGPPEEPAADTGLLKLGALAGDFVRTGVGTLLPPGGVLGAGSSVTTTGAPLPRWIEPFSWGPDGRGVHAEEKFVAAVVTAMDRRGIAASEAARQWLSDVWQASGAADRAYHATPGGQA
ncbi:MAG: hypothetical protein J4G03_05370 [Gemmatimonadetes bacterium]|nr:hypothetical protein [Gemmatimonadota bacterium]